MNQNFVVIVNSLHFNDAGDSVNVSYLAIIYDLFFTFVIFLSFRLSK